MAEELHWLEIERDMYGLVLLRYMSRPVLYQDHLKRNCYRPFHPESLSPY